MFTHITSPSPHALDAWTLQSVLDRKYELHMECKGCTALKKVDVGQLLKRLSGAETLAAIQARGVCQSCNKRRAKLFLRQPNMRGPQAWFPAPPSSHAP